VDDATVENALTDIEGRYPPELSKLLEDNRKRIIWQVQEVVRLVKPGGRVLDLGSGVVPFMPVLASLGYEVIMADDYGDAYYGDKKLSGMLDFFQSIGVRIVRRDIFEKDFADEFERLDMVTTHDSMEHWHNSPKRLFHDLWKRLNDDGLLWIGVPNNANLRKRLTLLLGRAKWSQMADWYEQPVFRGHVREPDVDDLRYIARDLGAGRAEIAGRNWIGYRHPSALVRKLTPALDGLLQLRPSLCSDIYLYAWK